MFTSANFYPSRSMLLLTTSKNQRSMSESSIGKVKGRVIVGGDIDEISRIGRVRGSAGGTAAVLESSALSQQ